MSCPCRLFDATVLLLNSQIAFRQLCIQYGRTSLNKISDKHLFLLYLGNASDISVDFPRALVKVAWVVKELERVKKYALFGAEMSSFPELE